MDPFATHGVAADTETLLRLRHVARARRSQGTRLTGMPGGFVSKRRGRGLEPDEIRAYAEGDDMRHIDRNVTARTGIPHVRTFRDERDRTVLLLADFRPCMLWGTRRAFRSVAAAEALALAGWNAVDAGARVGLLAFGAGDPLFIRARGRERGMIAVVGGLVTAHQKAFQTKGDPPLSDALELAANILPAGGTLILATGMDNPGGEFDPLVSRLARHGRLGVCLIVDEFEVSAPAGTYPYLTSSQGMAYATLGPAGQHREDPRIERLQALGADVFPIAAAANPDTWEVPAE